MPRGRKKKVVAVEDVEFMKTIESIIGRELTSAETQKLAIAARNFVKDNFQITEVYDADTISEAVGGTALDNEEDFDDGEIDAHEEDDYYYGGRND